MHRWILCALMACVVLDAQAQSPTPDRAVVVPAGTKVRIEMLEALDSASASPGQAFKARVAEEMRIDGVAVIPAGTPAQGTVLSSTPAGRWSNAGSLVLQADIVAPDGRRWALRDLSVGGTAPERRMSAMGQVFAPQRSGYDMTVAAGTVAVATLAQTVSNAPAPDTSAPRPAAPAGCCAIAAGAPIELELAETVGSGTHATGQAIAFKLIDDIRVDGVVVVPAGHAVTGAVVHAAKSRGGGAPGELLLAARTLDINGRTLRLRGLRLGASGVDQSGKAMGMAVAAGAFAMLIKGREVEIPADTRASAKVADAVLIPVSTTALTGTTPSE